MLVRGKQKLKQICFKINTTFSLTEPPQSLKKPKEIIRTNSGTAQSVNPTFFHPYTASIFHHYNNNENISRATN